MNIPNVKDLVMGDQKVYFSRYVEDHLWYRNEAGTFEFPVPISDTGSGVFLPEDKATYFMRWIRAHIQFLTDANNSKY